MDVRLTRREIQCVRLAGEGLTNKEIARRIGGGTAPKTVSNHLSNAYAKLGTSDRFRAAEIVATTYPDLSRLSPIPMAPPPPGRPPVMSSGGTAGDDGDSGSRSSWLLPRPSKGVAVRMGIIIVFAAAGALVLVGIVAVMWASLSLTKPIAPPNAYPSQM